MKIPHGFTEAQVTETILKVANTLGPSFAFGYYSAEDIAQEAARFACEALPRYDPGGYNEDGSPRRPLENFLCKHARNRLINLKRNKSHRTDPPCKLCASGEKHSDGEQCHKYKEWLKRNQTKQHLTRPLPIDGISDEKEQNTRQDSTVVDDAANIEILAIIDSKLSVELRATYLLMRSGEAVPKSIRRKVEEAIMEILRDGGILEEEDDG